MAGATYRRAVPGDEGLILQFVKELAEYERLSHQVQATEAQLAHWIFERGKAGVIFVLIDGKEVGFALYFNNFSTFLGKPGIYLEDLYVRPECRGLGCGKGLLKELARIAVSEGCGRLEWSCLDWNRPSIDFYLSLGAEPMDGWSVYRMCGESLQKLAK